jgi:hypothetical protein
MRVIKAEKMNGSWRFWLACGLELRCTWGELRELLGNV